MDPNISFGWHLFIVIGDVLLVGGMVLLLLAAAKKGPLAVIGSFFFLIFCYFCWTAVSMSSDNPLSMDREIINNENPITAEENDHDMNSTVDLGSDH